MTVKPVSPTRIQIAKEAGLQNVDTIALTCREARVPFPVACALFQKESGGRNVYGNDRGGTLSGYPYEVTVDNYRVFRWLVVTNGHVSNGVGPVQITYAGALKNGRRDGGFFKQMEDQDLKPWDVHDNMLFGLQLLRRHYLATGSWRAAGERYNGAAAYGEDLLKRISEWQARFRP